MPLLSQIAPTCKEISWYSSSVQGTVLARSKFYIKKVMEGQLSVSCGGVDADKLLMSHDHELQMPEQTDT